MKKGLCLFLAAILALSFSSCGTVSPTQAPFSSTPQATAAVATETPAATTQAVATESPDPHMDPNPELTVELYSIPKPPSAAFKPAEALAKKVMKEKKWTKIKHAGTVKDALAIALAGSTVYTPEQLAARLKKNINQILIQKNAGSAYIPSLKAIQFDANNTNLNLAAHVLTSHISGYAEHMNHRDFKIDGAFWCFDSSKSIDPESQVSHSSILWGLMDFISNLSMPGVTQLMEGNKFNGTTALMPTYDDGTPSQSVQQGPAILFYYASGSREVEKAFFGDPKASDAYKVDFAERFGPDKLDTLITMADDVSLYHGYTAGMTAEQQAAGLEKIKAYEDMMLGLLETRLANVKTQQDLDALKSDFEYFVKLNLLTDDAAYMKSINTRIVAIWKAMSAKTFS